MSAAQPSPRAERTMTFQREFWQVLQWRPREALLALYWRVLGKRLRARNILRRSLGDLPHAYDRWSMIIEGNLAAALPGKEWEYSPKFSIHIDTAQLPSGSTSDAIISLVEQDYGDWELLLTVAAGDLPACPADPRIRLLPKDSGKTPIETALEVAQGEYFMSLGAKARLTRFALRRFVEALQDKPLPALLYGDQDLLDGGRRRHAPWWKPRWQRQMFLSQDFVTRACLVRVAEARACLPLSPLERLDPIYALVLRISEADGAKITNVQHVQCSLTHFTLEEGRQARLAIASAHVEASGASVVAGPFGSLQVRWPLPATPPLVSLIVPTRDKVDVLRPCIESVLKLTAYRNFEVLIVDNNSVEEETSHFLAEISTDPRVRVLADTRPYNYSALNNAAVLEARGEFLCLLNNDTEVIAADWLTDMMRYAVQRHVGAVGAKLLYPTGQIQHAGVVVGMGEAAGHAHRYLEEGECGYFAQAHIAREVTAVTAACLLLEKRKFVSVGGLDEDHLAIAFNDVDLCLKLQQAGFSNIYEPAAVLYHHESISRGNDLAKPNRDRYFAELAVLQKRWGTKHFRDPLHHPMLQISIEQYVTALKVDLQ